MFLGYWRRCCIVSKKAGDVLRILDMLHSVKGSRGCFEYTGEDVAWGQRRQGMY